MMKRMLNSMNIVLTLTVLLLLSGCGKSPEEKLVGAWQETGGENNIVEFFEDGTFSLKPKGAETAKLQNVNGKWIILQDGRLKIDVSMLGITQSQVGKLEFDGKEMIIIGEDGTVHRHRRIQ